MYRLSANVALFFTLTDEYLQMIIAVLGAAPETPRAARESCAAAKEKIGRIAENN